MFGRIHANLRSLLERVPLKTIGDQIEARKYLEGPVPTVESKEKASRQENFGT